MTIVEFDIKKRHSTRAKDKNGDWWRIEGKCVRCGQCCNQNCDNLTCEKVDGKQIMKCIAEFYKPFMCALYPSSPDNPLKEGCGFSWEKE